MSAFQRQGHGGTAGAPCTAGRKLPPSTCSEIAGLGFQPQQHNTTFLATAAKGWQDARDAGLLALSGRKENIFSLLENRVCGETEAVSSCFQKGFGLNAQSGTPKAPPRPVVLDWTGAVSTPMHSLVSCILVEAALLLDTCVPPLHRDRSFHGARELAQRLRMLTAGLERWLSG